MTYRNAPPPRDPKARFEELMAAFRRDPRDVGVQIELGQLSLELGELDRAQKLFRALLLQKLDGAFTKADAFYHLALVEKQRGERTRALAMLERALEAEPSHAKSNELVALLK
jgi:tetratricopeptide (TPR) repeat protein